MPVNKNELTKEQIAKAMACETAEELMALAKSEGIELTKEEAEAYLAEMDDMELDSDALKNVAGGLCYSAGLGADQRCNRGGGITGAR
ncbi:MAG: hypothetical protein J5915_07515 [Acidaminococcaceae bacterium]|jgi:predicted ribosomally synthesized peptide with nif11-like leader|nr:hypothetical protein [Acidaminococcaceae bacterium]MBO6182338.1 hypothetical protein [Acidaminococcaceae bacterium]MBP3264815.1 hypothetical protein [Acidaminococcaceae bacterium]MBQ8491622.1 hypothetical protein [Acidaminococcaceae bacterium]MBQ9255657.1 hypothetical protein [Acidaminococcaceae bacterium]